jgi:hypothetical protein
MNSLEQKTKGWKKAKVTDLEIAKRMPTKKKCLTKLLEQRGNWQLQPWQGAGQVDEPRIRRHQDQKRLQGLELQRHWNCG